MDFFGFPQAGCAFAASAVSVKTYEVFTYYIEEDCVHILSCDSAAISVTIPNTIDGVPVTTIDANAFENCTSLRYVDLGSVTSVSTQSFYNCTELTSLVLPSSLENVGDQAFWGCDSLTEITFQSNSCEIYDSADTIPEQAEIFGYADSTAISYAVSYNRNFSLISVNTAENYLDDAEDGLSWKISEDTSVLTISGAGEIPDYTADESTPWSMYNNNIKTIVIEEGTTRIGNYAFYAIKNLQSISIPESVENFGISIFSNLSGSCGDNAYWNLDGEGILRIFGSGEMEHYQSYSDNTASVYDDEMTTPWNDFRSFIQEVYVEDGITQVGNWSFARLKNLRYVSLSDSVTDIGIAAFRYSTLYTIRIPENLSSIGLVAFNSCTELQRITIPESVPCIYASSFANSGLEEMYIMNPELFIYGVLSSNAILYSYSGSTVESYASENNLIFVALDENLDSTTTESADTTSEIETTTTKTADKNNKTVYYSIGNCYAYPGRELNLSIWVDSEDKTLSCSGIKGVIEVPQITADVISLAYGTDSYETFFGDQCMVNLKSFSQYLELSEAGRAASAQSERWIWFVMTMNGVYNSSLNKELLELNLEIADVDQVTSVAEKAGLTLKTGEYNGKTVQYYEFQVTWAPEGTDKMISGTNVVDISRYEFYTDDNVNVFDELVELKDGFIRVIMDEPDSTATDTTTKTDETTTTTTTTTSKTTTSTTSKTTTSTTSKTTTSTTTVATTTSTTTTPKATAVTTTSSSTTTTVVETTTSETTMATSTQTTTETEPPVTSSSTTTTRETTATTTSATTTQTTLTTTTTTRGTRKTQVYTTTSTRKTQVYTTTTISNTTTESTEGTSSATTTETSSATTTETSSETTTTTQTTQTVLNKISGIKDNVYWILSVDEDGVAYLHVFTDKQNIKLSSTLMTDINPKLEKRQDLLEKIKSLVIDIDGVESIESRAFDLVSMQSGMESVRTLLNCLDVVDIGSSVTEVGEFAFRGTSANALIFSENMITIGMMAFYDTNISEIQLRMSESDFWNHDMTYQNWLDYMNNDIKYMIASESELDPTDEMISAVSQMQLTSIGASAFLDCDFTNVILSETATDINPYSVGWLTSPEYNSSIQIDDFTVYGWGALRHRSTQTIMG